MIYNNVDLFLGGTMEYWFSEQQVRLRNLPSTRRYLYTNIDWSLRCLGILGARGTGKTTMMLQYLLEYHQGSQKALYVSIDHPRFQAESLYDFGREFYAYGGKTLLLDEVHKYENWASQIKTLYDSCPELQIIFSGSSILQLHEQDADLSRRAVAYYLHGLSFREFLLFELKKAFPIFNLQDILQQHLAFAQQINNQINVLEYFRNYLRYGYYPFFLEGKDSYVLKLSSVVNQVLESDLPMARHVDRKQISKLKKLVTFLALNVPSKVNIQKLAGLTEISRPKVYEYLESLSQARILNLVRESGGGYRILSKPDKIFLENTNLASALAEKVNIGTIRETFFVNQIYNAFSSHPAPSVYPINTAVSGDFHVNNEFTFEIGGKSKGTKQIQGIDKAFVAADEIEAGFGRKIPLWLFGFLY
jgi:predicted AAA+ superfamily ATPase